MWTQSPVQHDQSRFGSVRGASSFGVTSPKMYIDGIEVANPLGVHSNSTLIALIGWKSFVARRAPRCMVRMQSVVWSTSLHAARWSVRQANRRMDCTHAWWHGYRPVRFQQRRLRAGPFPRLPRRKRTAFAWTSGWAWARLAITSPAVQSDRCLADADVRFVGSRTLFTGTTRFAAKSSGALTSPVLAGIGAPTYQTTPNTSEKNAGLVDGTVGESPFGKPGMHADSVRMKENDALYRNSGVDPNAKQSLVQYTVGTTGTFTASPRWTHTLVAGVDGYRMNGISTQGMAVSVATDSLDRLAHTEADRTTLALRSTARMGDDEGFATSVILGAEQTATRQEIESHDNVVAGELSINARAPEQSLSFWSNTAGLLSQVNTSWRNTLFLSAGGRAEYSSGAAQASRVNLLPMLGASYVREQDGQTLKLRAAYGKGIRPSNSVARAATWMSAQAANYVEGARTARLALESLRNLEPEAQAGTELGADVLFGNGLGLHATRFDQRATGLIQAVALPNQSRVIGGANNQSIAYELQNVGAITNRGWELQATSLLGRFSLQGSASFVDSRVRQVANSYSGELRPGDRMLEVPAQTFGVSGTYSAPRWSGSLGVSRAMNWINYDQLAIAERQSAAGFDPRTVTGAYLRNYWREYSGVNRLRSTFSYSLTRGLSLIMTGDNLLNLQRGEPDNVTVVPGRTLTLGIRTRF